jgi:predicted outer membrane protein
MNARFHHRVAWIIAAALGGVAACAGGEGKSTTAGRDGGVASAADCLGPTWFGGLDTTARSKLVGLVCADARSGSLAAGRLDTGAGPSCKGAFAALSDDEIEAILAAVDDGETREGTLAQANATKPAVRDLAHALSVAHTRSGEQARARVERRKGRAEENEVSRAIAAGFTAANAVLHAESGPAFDDEFLARVMVQHARELEMFDDLVPQAKNAETRCAVEKARSMALSHLQLACVVSGQVGAAPPARPAPRVGRIGSGAAACTEEGAPAACQEPPAGASVAVPEEPDPEADGLEPTCPP